MSNATDAIVWVLISLVSIFILLRFYVRKYISKPSSLGLDDYFIFVSAALFIAACIIAVFLLFKSLDEEIEEIEEISLLQKNLRIFQALQVTAICFAKFSDIALTQRFYGAFPNNLWEMICLLFSCITEGLYKRLSKHFWEMAYLFCSHIIVVAYLVVGCIETSRIFSPAISSVVADPDSSKPYIWASAGLKTALDLLIFIRLIWLVRIIRRSELGREKKVGLAAVFSLDLVKLPLNFVIAYFAVKPYTNSTRAACVQFMIWAMATEYIRTIILVFNPLRREVFNPLWRKVSHTDKTPIPSTLVSRSDSSQLPIETPVKGDLERTNSDSIYELGILNSSHI